LHNVRTILQYLSGQDPTESFKKVISCWTSGNEDKWIVLSAEVIETMCLLRMAGIDRYVEQYLDTFRRTKASEWYLHSMLYTLANIARALYPAHLGLYDRIVKFIHTEPLLLDYFNTMEGVSDDGRPRYDYFGIQWGIQKNLADIFLIAGDFDGLREYTQRYWSNLESVQVRRMKAFMMGFLQNTDMLMEHIDWWYDEYQSQREKVEYESTIRETINCLDLSLIGLKGYIKMK
jgi:hypothetical protein